MSSEVPYSNEEAYGYTPTAWVCITFIVIFSITTVAHVVQATWSKYWIIYPTLGLGGALEIIGWAGRYSSNRDPSDTSFIIQICCLIFAPVFFSAFLYTMLGVAISRLGAEYSLLKPRWYIALFVTADIISLVLQATGGGQAATAPADVDPISATHVMLSGIVFQLICMIVFTCLLIDFVVRIYRKKPYKFHLRRMEKAGNLEMNRLRDGNDNDNEAQNRVKSSENSSVNRGFELEDWGRWKIMLAGVGFSSMMIILRGFYRSVELGQGFNGYLINHETYQNVLDGIPMVFAVAVFNFIHPGYVLPKRTSWKGYH